MAKLTRLLRRQEEIIERWTAAGGPGFEGRARALLAEVGLDDDDLGKPTRVLSGGQRKLVGLAACLLRDPDVLLLDEPEAHLDVEAREQHGAADASLRRRGRRRLARPLPPRRDRLADRRARSAAAFACGRATTPPTPSHASSSCSASSRCTSRSRRRSLGSRRRSAASRTGRRRVVDERHIKQARNKQRQIDRMDKIDRPVLERRKIALDLRPHARGGERVVELTGVGVELGGNPILAGVDLTVLRGERVGVVGENGAGKSVLLRVLAAELEPDEGEREVGPVDPLRPPRAGPPSRRSEGDAAPARAPRRADLRGRGGLAADEVPLLATSRCAGRSTRSQAASGRGCSCCC